MEVCVEVVAGHLEFERTCRLAAPFLLDRAGVRVAERARDAQRGFVVGVRRGGGHLGTKAVETQVQGGDAGLLADAPTLEVAAQPRAGLEAASGGEVVRDETGAARHDAVDHHCEIEIPVGGAHLGTVAPIELQGVAFEFG